MLSTFLILTCFICCTAIPFAAERPPPAVPMSVDSFALLGRDLSPVFRNEKDEQCKIDAVDLVFVVDESGSIGNEFGTVLTFLSNITMSLDIGTGDKQSQVGMVEFSTVPRITFLLNAYKTGDDVRQAIARAPYAGQGTVISSGMNLAVQQVFTPNGGSRPAARKVMIVLTDGYGTDSNEDIQNAHQAALAKNIDIFAIGIGSEVNVQQLINITGSASKVFLVQDFTGLPSILPSVCNGVNSTDNGPNGPNTPHQCSCTYSNLYLDIIFIADSSNGVMQEDYFDLNGVFSNIVELQTVSQTIRHSSRIGFIAFTSSAVVYADLNKFNSSNETSNFLDHVPYIGGRGSSGGFAAALSAANEMFKSRTTRTKNRKVVVIASSVDDECVTSNSRSTDNSPCRTANIMKENGVTIVTIAYSFPEGSGTSRLSIASPCQAYINTQLDLQQRLLKSFCDANCYCPWDENSDWGLWKMATDESTCKKVGECVQLGSTANSWTRSLQTCSRVGANLADVFSADKHDFLTNLTTNAAINRPVGAVPYWIGLNDRAQRGQYSWSRSSGAEIPVHPNDYARWAIGNPNEANGACISVVNTGSYGFRWQSTSCDNSPAFPICQINSCDTDNFCS